MVRNFRRSQKWKHGVIMQRLGPLSYMVKVQDRMRHVRIDHLIVGTNSETPAPEAHGKVAGYEEPELPIVANDEIQPVHTDTTMQAQAQAPHRNPGAIVVLRKDWTCNRLWLKHMYGTELFFFYIFFSKVGDLPLRVKSVLWNC